MDGASCFDCNNQQLADDYLLLQRRTDRRSIDADKQFDVL